MNSPLPKPLVVSALHNLDNNQQEIQNVHDRVLSDMIAKAVESSITKTSLKNSSLHRRGYEWTDAGGIISNDVTTMLYLIFKGLKPYTSIVVSNLREEI